MHDHFAAGLGEITLANLMLNHGNTSVWETDCA
jgi:hypothetical protein